MGFTLDNLDLDLDNNRQSPDGYFGNGVCTPTGMM